MGSLPWIGWSLTAIGLVTGFLYFRANRKVKRFDWWIDSDQDLINFPGSDIAEEITVLVDDEKLEHPRAVQITIKNTGNVGLNTENMYKPFEVHCTGDQELRTASVRRSLARQGRSEDVPILVTPGRSGHVEPTWTLLNSGDYLTCQLLLDGKSGGVEVLGEAEDFEVRRVRSQNDLRPMGRQGLLRDFAIAVTVGVILLTLPYLSGKF